MKSITSVYKIGNGPSSSHTVGPYHAAQTFRERTPDADRYQVTLYGSLACTGEGHGTAKAIRAILSASRVEDDQRARLEIVQYMPPHRQAEKETDQAEAE